MKKKGFLWILALILCLCAFPGLGEEKADPSPLGDWYALQDGLTVKLTFREDGTYVLDLPALPGDAEGGAWELTDGFIRLDGDDDLLFSFDGDRLVSGPLGLYFSREPGVPYVPAGPMPDAKPEDMNGYWRCGYVETEGATLPAAFAGDDTELYIEAPMVALGGSVFGDVIVEFTFENGALVRADEEVTLRLECLEDGLLRLTADDGESPLIWYLFSARSAYLDGEAAAD